MAENRKAGDTMKRDLQADLAWVNDPDVCLSQRVREICNHAIRRAMEAEREVERLREALELLYRVTCTNGADPDDVKPPVGRANWSTDDREKALKLAKEALGMFEKEGSGMSEKRDLAADLKICEEALPGPWDVKPNGQRCYQVVDHGVYVIADWLSLKNAEFISIAREALPYWLKLVQELEAENARLREDMDFLKQEYRDSEEPMTDDAIELQARLKILQERDELRAENRRLRSVLSDIPKILRKLYKALEV